MTPAGYPLMLRRIAAQRVIRARRLAWWRERGPSVLLVCAVVVATLTMLR